MSKRDRFLNVAQRRMVIAVDCVSLRHSDTDDYYTIFLKDALVRQHIIDQIEVEHNEGKWVSCCWGSPDEGLKITISDKDPDRHTALNPNGSLDIGFMLRNPAPQ